MRLAIFAALRWECRAVLQPLHRVSRIRVGTTTTWRGECAAGDILVVQTGMGIERATAALRAIHGEPSPDVMLSTGCAGALDPELGPGDLAIATALVDSVDAKNLPTDPALSRQLRNAAARIGVHPRFGPVLCSPTVLATARSKRLAREATGAIAVEMEGMPLACGAADLGVPFASVRVILDTSTTELADTTPFFDPASGSVRPFALAAHLTRHPSTLKDLLTMQPMLTSAREGLERFFVALLGQSQPFGPEIDG